MARKKIREYDAKRLLKQNIERLSPAALDDSPRTSIVSPSTSQTFVRSSSKDRLDSHTNGNGSISRSGSASNLSGSPLVNLNQLNPVQVTPTTNYDDLLRENPWMREERLVVKPDMLFGKRGKTGLLLLNADIFQAKEFIESRIGKDMEVGGLKGTVTHFIVEKFLPHKHEFYLSILSQREETVINFSVRGGIEVEESWDESMLTVSVPILTAIEDVDLESALAPAIVKNELETVAADASESTKKLVEEVGKRRADITIAFIRACYNVFEDLDFTLLEMNPFTFSETYATDAANESGFKEPISIMPIPLDMRGELDDTALFKNMKKWKSVEFPQPFGRSMHPEEKLISELDEQTGASLKLTILNPKGRIWLMVAGGGASVIYTDTIVDLGYANELANYGEYSGAPNEEETYVYARTIIDLATRDNSVGRGKALIIGGGIANFTDVAKTFKGIVNALREYRERLVASRVRIFVRRAGPNYKVGLKLLRDLGEELGIPICVFGPEIEMTKIVPMAIKYIEQSA